eukprot:gene158-biopygen612
MTDCLAGGRTPRCPDVYFPAGWLTYPARHSRRQCRSSCAAFYSRSCCGFFTRRCVWLVVVFSARFVCDARKWCCPSRRYLAHRTVAAVGRNPFGDPAASAAVRHRRRYRGHW